MKSKISLVVEKGEKFVLRERPISGDYILTMHDLEIVFDKYIFEKLLRDGQRLFMFIHEREDSSNG